ncbi:OLC1v1025341C1 [Oldenlandia corymbosa var. corymbosa]|uniref:OLC1v1025341C1 n=1 Tax=Oldenlandia corymbosa var. corymbosa TaxID=529605 RepID=A0AAV1C7U7_OLDCO|nr:OLC1v1025341C1 [Oldenlandia corymbosa var. corymbosa]
MENWKMSKFLLFQFQFLLLSFHSKAYFPFGQDFNEGKNYEGSSNLVDLQYHMGPVLANPINLYIIWYGHWNPSHQSTIRDFIYSFSPATTAPHPSVADWWQVVRLYTDQTNSNITGSISLSGEFFDNRYTHGKFLTRLSMQSVIKTALYGSNSNRNSNNLPLNFRNGLYLILTSHDVSVQDFCRAVCGFHYFTFPSVVGVTVPYAWVGYSGTQCPGMCAYPFAWPNYSGKPPPGGNGGRDDLMGPPNGDPGVDGMISVIAHELAEVSSNPLVNAWYAGDDPTAPTEIADLCLGVYGTGGGGGFVGVVSKDGWGNGYNVNGINGRRFLVQWVWNPARNRCFGPNALD